MTGLTGIQVAALLGGSLTAAVTDLRARKIPNLLTGPLWLAGLCWAAWTGGIGTLGNALLCSIVLALPFVALFVIARGGAGDAKLMAALGAWLGLGEGFLMLGIVAASGVLLGFSYAFLRGRRGRLGSHLRQIVYAADLRRRGFRDEARHMVPDHADMLEMPYALAILVGVMVYVGVEMAWQA